MLQKIVPRTEDEAFFYFKYIIGAEYNPEERMNLYLEHSFLLDSLKETKLSKGKSR